VLGAARANAGGRPRLLKTRLDLLTLQAGEVRLYARRLVPVPQRSRSGARDRLFAGKPTSHLCFLRRTVVGMGRTAHGDLFRSRRHEEPACRHGRPERPKRATAQRPYHRFPGLRSATGAAARALGAGAAVLVLDERRAISTSHHCKVMREILARAASGLGCSSLTHEIPTHAVPAPPTRLFVTGL